MNFTNAIRTLWNACCPSLYACSDIVLPTNCLVCKRHNQDGPLCRLCHPGETVPIDRRCSKCFGELSGIQTDISCEYNVHPSSDCQLCRLFPLPFSTLISLWEYEGIARELVTVTKYRPSQRLAFWLAKHAASCIARSASWQYSPTHVVPIPPNPESSRERPFHFTAILAKYIATVLGARLDLRSLKHTGDRPTQASLRNSDRYKNSRGIFAPIRNSAFRDTSVLLVDDVVTTGATVCEASKILLDAGVAEVGVFCITIAPSWGADRAALAAAISRAAQMSHRE